ncbi:hypothetical protein LCGC14_0643980 [marine sediment metagenome]|uniref:Uncharacterized protein n=1 Tax=marine sediment metagenome TaxID=412755 RepID=A0A0F9R3G6_9ZZZZ
MSGEREQTQEELTVPVTRGLDGIRFKRQVATGHFDGRPYTLSVSLDMRYLTVLIDNFDPWQIDMSELALAVRKRADDIDKEAR